MTPYTAPVPSSRVFSARARLIRSIVAAPLTVALTRAYPFGRFAPVYSARGVSTARRRRSYPMPLTAEDIARLTRTPVRTVRARLARWRRAGAAVIALPSRGGRPPLGIAREDYARIVGLDTADLDA